jgi:hypothetical protein
MGKNRICDNHGRDIFMSIHLDEVGRPWGWVSVSAVPSEYQLFFIFGPFNNRFIYQTSAFGRCLYIKWVLTGLNVTVA